MLENTLDLPSHIHSSSFSTYSNPSIMLGALPGVPGVAQIRLIHQFAALIVLDICYCTY